MMRIILTVFLLAAPFLAHAGAPPTLLSDSFRKIPGAVAWFDPADNTLNGAGISALYDRTGNGRNLLQATANNQPLISRADNAGNLLLQSETFNTTWGLGRMNAFGAIDTGAAGAGSFANTSRTADPLGGNTADFIQEDATTANNHYISQAVSLTAGTHSMSAWVKAAGRTWVVLDIFHPSASVIASFDLQNGALGIVGASGTASDASSSISDAGNGWYLCTVSCNTGQIGAHTAYIFFGEGNNDITFNGDNTSGLFLWGASFRPASWDSTYIQTVATPAIAGMNGHKTAYCDGSADYLKTAAFTLNQPFSRVWTGLKAWTWTANDALSDGNSASSGKLYQVTATPRLTMAAGSDGPSTTSASLGSTYFLAGVYNGASSLLYLNAAAAATGDTGAGNPGGFTLGALATPANYAHAQFAEVLLYGRALDTNEVAYAGRLSNRKYNLGF